MITIALGIVLGVILLCALPALVGLLAWIIRWTLYLALACGAVAIVLFIGAAVLR